MAATPMPFTPAGYIINGSTSSSTSTASFTIVGRGNQLRVVNKSASWAWFRVGSSGAANLGAAVNTDLPMAPNSIELFSIDPDANCVAVILESGTGTFTATKGEGV